MRNQLRWAGAAVAALGIWSAQTASAASSWVKVSDPAQGGRVQQVQTSIGGVANTWLLASYGAGVYRSTDAGATWVNTGKTGLPNLRVAGFNYISATNLWVRLDGGVAQSTDNGATWTVRNDGLGCLTANSFTNDTTNNILYLSTYCATGGGLHTYNTSTNRWVKNTTLPDDQIFSISLSNSGNTIRAFGPDNMWISNDRGVTWSKLFARSTNGLPPDRDLQDWTFDGNQTYLLTIANVGTYRSTNAGAAWTPVTGVPAGAALRNFGIPTSMASRVYARSTKGGIYASSDGGASWTLYASANGAPNALGHVRSYTGEEINVAFLTTWKGLAISSDRGATWQLKNNGLGDGYYTNASAADQDGNDYVTIADKAYRTRDGGTTWTALQDVGDRPIAVGRDRTNPEIIIVSTVTGGIFKSTNGGTAFSAINSGLPYVEGNWFAYWGPNTQNLYAKSVDGSKLSGIYKSNDGGASWSNSSSGLSAAAMEVIHIAVHPTDANIAYASAADGIYKTTNGGGQWTKTSFSAFQSVGVVIDPTDPNRVFAAASDQSPLYANGATGGVYRSDNAGTTWRKMTSASSQQLSFVNLGYNEEVPVVYARYTRGAAPNGELITRSFDLGTTWYRGDDGLDGVPHGVINGPRGQAKYFASQGGGIYRLNRTGSFVREFYNTDIKHYFYTADPAEAQAIRSGSAGPGWIETGRAIPEGGSKKVCRFYGMTAELRARTGRTDVGPNSHFYTIDQGECDFLKNNRLGWFYEGDGFSSAAPTTTPTTACAAGTIPIYRLWNNRGTADPGNFNDGNHRYAVSIVTAVETADGGWKAEGFTLCAPLP